jgi:Ser/Thr protein kinase RdoA (MazF antagonist)
MVGKKLNYDRQRETTRRPASDESVFLSALAGTGDENTRAVIRNDIYQQALESAKRVLRIYHSERRRQL